MTNDEEKAREWFSKQPKCIGYPGCDGDLVGLSHEPECPYFDKPEPTIVELLASYGSLREQEGRTHALKLLSVCDDCEQTTASECWCVECWHKKHAELLAEGRRQGMETMQQAAIDAMDDMLGLCPNVDGVAAITFIGRLKERAAAIRGAETKGEKQDEQL